MRETVVEDDAIPKTARLWMLRVYDLLWPEVQRELYAAGIKEAGHRLRQFSQPTIPDGVELTLRSDPVRYLRGRFLYNIYPYDLSIWKRLRNPKWRVAFILSIFPFFGLQASTTTRPSRHRRRHHWHHLLHHRRQQQHQPVFARSRSTGWWCGCAWTGGTSTSSSTLFSSSRSYQLSHYVSLSIVNFILEFKVIVE